MRYENVLCVRLADDELRDRRTCEKPKLKKLQSSNVHASAQLKAWQFVRFNLKIESIMKTLIFSLLAVHCSFPIYVFFYQMRNDCDFSTRFGQP